MADSERLPRRTFQSKASSCLSPYLAISSRDKVACNCQTYSQPNMFVLIYRNDLTNSEQNDCPETMKSV